MSVTKKKKKKEDQTKADGERRENGNMSRLNNKKDRKRRNV